MLIESPLEDEPGFALGTSGRYTPVVVPEDSRVPGEFVDVLAGESTDGRIRSADLP